MYCLRFVVADYQDIINRILNPHLTRLNVELSSATVIKDKRFVHIDNRKKLESIGRINFYRIIFRATKAAKPVIFNDEKAETK